MTSDSGPNGSSTPATTGLSEASTLLPHAPHYSSKGSLPNTPLSVSVISAALGGIGLSCLTLAALPLLQNLSGDWARPQLGLYGFAWGFFHLCEFWTTAGWNPLKLSVDGVSLCLALAEIERSC